MILMVSGPRGSMKYWMDYDVLCVRETLEQLLDDEKTPIGVARRVGCSRQSVKSAMKYHGLSIQRVKMSEDIRKKLGL